MGENIPHDLTEHFPVPHCEKGGEKRKEEPKDQSFRIAQLPRVLTFFKINY